MNVFEKHDIILSGGGGGGGGGRTDGRTDGWRGGVRLAGSQKHTVDTCVTSVLSNLTWHMLDESKSRRISKNTSKAGLGKSLGPDIR